MPEVALLCRLSEKENSRAAELEKEMDNYMDAFASNGNSDELIKVNSLAEAKEMEETRKQVSDYEDLLNQLRNLNFKCVETQEATSQLVAASIEKIEEIRDNGTADPSIKEKLDAIYEKLSQIESVNCNTGTGAGNAENVVSEASKEGNPGDFSNLENFIHKENVRVYRNVQASVIDELKLQTEALAEQNSNLEDVVRNVKSKMTMLTVFSVASLIGIVVCIFLMYMGLGI